MSLGYLTIVEFAALLKMHPNSIRSAIKRKTLKSIKIGIGKNASYRIPLSELERLETKYERL